MHQFMHQLSIITLKTKPSVTLLGLCTLHGLGAIGMELGS